MSLIKSAYELAMEKTEGLTVDKEALKREASFKKGRGLGMKALTEGVEFFSKEWAVLREEKDGVKEEARRGVLEAFLSTLNLKVYPEGDLGPQYPLGALLEALNGKKPGKALEQVQELLAQFREDAVQLKGAIIQQLGPRLKQRAEQMAAQAGVQMKYVMERDPEFLKVLNQNLDKLREQYQPHLDQFKADLGK